MDDMQQERFIDHWQAGLGSPDLGVRALAERVSTTACQLQEAKAQEDAARSKVDSLESARLNLHRQFTEANQEAAEALAKNLYGIVSRAATQ